MSEKNQPWTLGPYEAKEVILALRESDALADADAAVYWAYVVRPASPGDAPSPRSSPVAP